jgi:hypothetical protein
VKQASANGTMMCLFQIVTGCTLSVSIFINAATVAFVTKMKNVKQENFIVEVVPSLGYLQQVFYKFNIN